MKDAETNSEREPCKEERSRWLAEAEFFHAQARRSDAQAALHSADVNRAKAEASVATDVAAVGRLERENVERKYAQELAGDIYNHIYHFNGDITPASTAKCMEKLTQWNRLDPHCDITIIFNSPGGSVVDGLELWDFLAQLKADGHNLITVTRGMAASMAGILLQAGHVRRMGAQASLMIHEASFTASGTMGNVEDTVKWVEAIQQRILDIFADRAKSSAVERPITRAQLESKWKRRNWWIMSDEALKLGLVDEIG